MRRFSVLALALAAALPGSILDAQVFAVSPASRHTGPWTFDFGAQMAQPVGDFNSQIDRAWGLGGSVRYHHHEFPLGLRSDLAWLNYGSERKTVPLSATVNRVLVDMNTLNNIALATVGPELMLMRGPIRPYAYAFAGFSYFYTESSAGDDNDGGGYFASTTNFDDGGWTSGFGGGVRLPIFLRNVEAALDAGARMTYNGVRSYLREGDILDQPDGTLVFNQRRTRADFWQYYLGLSFTPKFR